MASRIRWAWDWFSDLWTAKDFAIWVYAIGGAAVLGPVVVRAFSPLSAVDFVLIAAFCGLVAFFLARHFLSRAHSIETAQPLELLEDADLAKQATRWLSVTLSDRKLHLEKRAYLFGSIIHDHYETSDVDVIVEFQPIKDSQIAKSVRRIRNEIASAFQQKFGHKLHVTFFCANEQAQRVRLSD